MAENNSENISHQDDNLAVGAKGGAIAFGLKISATALGLINQIILARILGAGGIGEVILAVTVVRISAQIAKFGMEETMMKFVPRYIDQDDHSRLKGTISFAIRFCLLFSIVFMLLILALSKIISINIFHSEALVKLMPVAAIAIPAWVMRDVMGGILKGYKDALRALIPESLVAPFFRIVILLILILKGISPLYAVIAFVAGEIISVFVSLKFLLNKVKKLKVVKRQCENKKIMDVAYTIIFTSMSVLLYTQSDIWVLGMFTSTETVGIYGIATKLMILVYFPMLALFAIIPPLISSIHATGDLQELRRIIRESTRWILSIAMPIILILILEGKFILKYVFGPEFVAGYIVLIILTLGQMIKAGSGLVGVLLQMTGEHKIYMKINMFGGIFNILLNVLLVPRFGMIGAAIATAVCLSMVDVICIAVAFRRKAVITLARGLKFDIFFIAGVAVTYFLFNYGNVQAGNHLLLIAALAVYLWKSVYYHDLPWQLFLSQYKKRQIGA